MVYNYRKAMMDDIKTAIKDEYENFDEFEDRDELFEDMYEKFWVMDEVTGNGSPECYPHETCAEDCLKGNWDLVRESLSELGMPKIESFDADFFDVSVRCYLLGEVLNDVLDEIL